MNKDAYYFPHFSNARNDNKLRRVRKELGVEGYGIYFMLLEKLREEEGLKYPTEDIDLLAEEFGTSEQKVRTVICNYKLFNVDDNDDFFSLKFMEYLQPYLDTKHKRRIDGIKGNLIRYGHLTKEQASGLTDSQLVEINNDKTLVKGLFVGGESGGESGCDRKESKVKKKKEEENIYKAEAMPKNILTGLQEMFGTLDQRQMPQLMELNQKVDNSDVSLFMETARNIWDEAGDNYKPGVLTLAQKTFKSYKQQSDETPEDMKW